MSELGFSGKLKIRCPACGRSLKGATIDMVGDIAVCPKCRTEFEITAPRLGSLHKIRSRWDSDPRRLTRSVLIGIGWYIFGILSITVALWHFTKSQMKTTDVFIIGFLVIWALNCFRMGTFFFKRSVVDGSKDDKTSD